MVLAEVILNFFRKRFTLRYPKEKPRLPKNFRGPVVWSRKTCIFCGACARNCPAFAIQMNKEAHHLAVDPYKCITCQVCEEICPTKPKSIHLTENLHASKVKSK